jgi:RHS repeat-associated protein
MEDGTDRPHQRLSLTKTIAAPGYVYIYLSNEGKSITEVYFDDFSVEHIQSPIVQRQDYYPFGLTFNEFGRESGGGSDYKYNGKELQDQLGLNWLDYEARMYMPDIGRWISIDPLADKFSMLSPYNYTRNNPIRFLDPDGRAFLDPYIIYNGEKKTMEIWDDKDTPDNYDDDLLLSSNDAKNDVATSSNGKWEDGEYAMVDNEEPHTHGNPVLDSQNGTYGTGGIYRAANFLETTTSLTRVGMGIHAGRANQDWTTGRKTMGCIRVKSEGFDAIGAAIEQEGPITKLIVQNNRNSDHSGDVSKIAPGAQYRAAAEAALESLILEKLRLMY